MTVITLSTLAQALGVPVVTDGVFEGTPWAGSRAAVRVDGAEVIVPAPVTVPITAGVPDDPINLEPNDGTWCWKVVVYTTRPAHRLTRYVTVPASGPVDFGALVDVDPTTFIATTEIVAAWELVSAEAAASAAAAASSASDAEADRVTAGTSAFNAGASAAAAQGSEEAAQTAREGAETAQSAAAGSATAAAGSATSAANSATEAASVGIATDATVAALVTSGPETGAALDAEYAVINGEQTFLGRKVFRDVVISRPDDGAGQISAKQVGDTAAAVFNWRHDGDYGYLFHMTCGSSMPATSALIGLGNDAGLGAAMQITNKAGGPGLRISNSATTTSAGNGFRFHQLSEAAVGILATMDSANAQTLASFRAHSATIAGRKLVTFNDKTGEAGAVLADTGVLQWSRPVRSGSYTTALRPTGLTSVHEGYQVWDSTIKKPIWWNGSAWIDANGLAV